MRPESSRDSGESRTGRPWMGQSAHRLVSRRVIPAGAEVQVDSAALPLDIVDLAFAIVLAPRLKGEQRGVPRERLKGRQHVPYRHAPSVAGSPHTAGATRSAQRSAPRLPRLLVQARRRIETVIGQLVERYHAKRVWARDGWHLWSRWQRKLLSHTLAVYLCQQAGLGSLRFADCSPPKPAHRVS
jgi:hypothetical protein